MSESKMDFRYVKGFPLIKIQGDFRSSTLNSLHLVARGSSEQGNIPIIIDVSDYLSVSDEIKNIRCDNITAWLSDMTLVIVGTRGRFDRINEILNLPHQLKYAETIEAAIDVINNMGKNSEKQP